MKSVFFSPSLRFGLGALVVLVLCEWQNVSAQTGIAVPGMSHCDEAVLELLEIFDLPGASLALAKDGKLVYARAFGHADLEGAEPVQPYHRFRIASISKPITAIAIMKLVEDGTLELDDAVFGEGGILGSESWVLESDISDPWVYSITVRHLLEHAAGWNRDINCFPDPAVPYPYWFSGCDPIVAPLHVAQETGFPNPAGEKAMIRYLLEKGLDFIPGTSYAYSNIGYLVLGEVIAAVSGLSYEAYVQESLLSPLGICDMALGNNLLENKQEREVEYQGNGFTNLSCYDTGEYVPWEYGGFNLEAMDAHGGWIASASDLVRLLVAVDGFDTKPDVLLASTINAMVEPGANNPYYAKGWSVNPAGNWWHTGALDGTATFFARTSGGYTWALLLNKRVIFNGEAAFWTALDQLPWECMLNTEVFPEHDLMLFPLQNASAASASNVGLDAMELEWERGDGDYCLVTARLQQTPIGYPLDGQDYLANGELGMGEEVAPGVFVMYAGSANYVSVTGLSENTSYVFDVFEFNRNEDTDLHALYNVCNRETLVQSTEGSNSMRAIEEGNVRVAPNPGSGLFELLMPEGRQATEVMVFDSRGLFIFTSRIPPSGRIFLDLSPYPSGVYTARLQPASAWKKPLRIMHF